MYVVYPEACFKIPAFKNALPIGLQLHANIIETHLSELVEWRNGFQPDFSEVQRLKGISNGKPWEIWLQSTHKNGFDMAMVVRREICLQQLSNWPLTSANGTSTCFSWTSIHGTNMWIQNQRSPTCHGIISPHLQQKLLEE